MFLNSFGIVNLGTFFIIAFYSSLMSSSLAYIRNNRSIQSILKYNVILLTFFFSPPLDTFLMWSAMKLQVFSMSLASVGLLIESYMAKCSGPSCVTILSYRLIFWSLILLMFVLFSRIENYGVHVTLMVEFLSFLGAINFYRNDFMGFSGFNRNLLKSLALKCSTVTTSKLCKYKNLYLAYQ